jgi:hypothetical protein
MSAYIFPHEHVAELREAAVTRLDSGVPILDSDEWQGFKVADGMDYDINYYIPEDENYCYVTAYPVFDGKVDTEFSVRLDT